MKREASADLRILPGIQPDDHQDTINPQPLLCHNNNTDEMLSVLASATVFGLPLAIVFGIIAFTCVLITAVLGYLVLKGRYEIPFAWHMRMAAVTIIIIIIHAVLVIAWLTG
jgi:uncharacterized membrane protein